MTDECTNIAVIEKMSVYCHWEESGSPEEHFLEIIHLKQANADVAVFCFSEVLEK